MRKGVRCEMESQGDTQVLLCCVFDKKACEMVGSVWMARTPGEAIRLFTDVVNQSGENKTVLQLHPEDFELVQCGFVDRSVCAVEGVYRVLIQGSEVKNGA